MTAMGPIVLTDYLTVCQREVLSNGQVCYTATHPEFAPGLRSQGDTPEEAVESLKEATEMVLRHLREHSLPIPAYGVEFQGSYTR